MTRIREIWNFFAFISTSVRTGQHLFCYPGYSLSSGEVENIVGVYDVLDIHTYFLPISVCRRGNQAGFSNPFSTAQAAICVRALYPAWPRYALHGW